MRNMQQKRIETALNKISSDNVIVEFETVFMNTRKILPDRFNKIQDIFSKYHVKIDAIGIDSYGYIYLDLVEVS
jgi:hypothetical protein